MLLDSLSWPSAWFFLPKSFYRLAALVRVVMLGLDKRFGELNMKATLLALLLLMGTSNTYASGEITLTGQEAKTLYLALEGVPELPARFYSLTRTVESLECRLFYKGPQYQKNVVCRLDNHFLVDMEETRTEGAQILFDALPIEQIAHAGNPPQYSKEGSVRCLLKSPIGEAPDQNPEWFSCKISTSVVE
jgi:hypothetical protein